MARGGAHFVQGHAHVYLNAHDATVGDGATRIGRDTASADSPMIRDIEKMRAAVAKVRADR